MAIATQQQRPQVQQSSSGHANQHQHHLSHLNQDHRMQQDELSQHSTNQTKAPLKRSSKIVNFYKNRSVLITGASGFIGKVLIEKLLRTCPELNRIFVLIRPKWKKQPHERLRELLEVPLFDSIRKQPNCLPLEERVIVVEGDVTLPNLGLSDENLSRIIDEVSVIFHSAATVKFDEPLKQSIGINIAGTKRMVDVCRKMSKLAALVHVSTAYANCDRPEIDEHIYPVDMNPTNLIEMSEWLDQDTLQELKARLLGPRPNTYTYTKALAEWLLSQIARDLPVVVCRPSIVVASWKEPFAGWIDNVNGPTGIILGAGKGIIRSMFAESSYRADLVPVDTVINMIISLGWFANVYHHHKRLMKDSDLVAGLSNESSSARISSESEDYGPFSLDALEGQVDSIDVQRVRETMASIYQHEGNNRDSIFKNYSQDSMENDSNNNDNDQDNQNHHDTFNGSLEYQHSDNLNHNLLDTKNDLHSQRKPQETKGGHTIINSLAVDDGYKSASRSPDSNSTSSSTSGFVSSVNKRTSQMNNNNNDTNHLDMYKRPPLSPEGNLRLTDQREAADLERKLKHFRDEVRNKLIAKDLPEDLADIPVFHCTSGFTRPLTWGQIQVFTLTFLALYPSISTYRYPCGTLTNSKHLDNFYRLTLHYIPGYFVDFITRIMGGKPVLVKILQKFDQAAHVLKAFTSKQWVFKPDNHISLMNDFMSHEDRELFNCDLSDLNWSDFIRDYVLGVRQFILKEPMNNLEQSKINLRIVYYRNLGLQVLFFALIAYYFF